MKECKKIIFRVEPSEIHYIRFILEATDGLALLTTLDVSQGLVVARVAPGCEDDFDEFLTELGKEIFIDMVSASHKSYMDMDDL